MDDANRHLSILDETECWELLQSAVVGMVAFVNTAGQQLMPVNIQALDRRVYFRIDDTTSLGVLAEGHDDVAMSATHADTMYGNGWNVTVRGSSRRVDDDTLREQLDHAHRRTAWAGGDRTVIVEVQPRSIDGRRVHHA